MNKQVAPIAQSGDEATRLIIHVVGQPWKKTGLLREILDTQSFQRR